MVPPARIELAAHGLGIHCSIHWATGAKRYDFKHLGLIIYLRFALKIHNCAQIVPTLRIKVGLLLQCSQFQILVIYDIIPVKYRSCLMARNHHCNSFRDTGTNHIPNGCTPEIVKKPYTNSSIFASALPGFIKPFNHDHIWSSGRDIGGTMVCRILLSWIFL